jgi:hypothetical protein
MLSKPFQCRDCGSLQAYRSQPRNLAEKYFLPIFLIYPVRCADCFRRTFRFRDAPVRPPQESHATKRAAA